MESTMTSKKLIWTGRVFSGLVIAFLTLDAFGKFAKPQQVIEATVKLGYDAGVLNGLGIVLLLSTILYAIPRTAVLGAILLTGYLGGAVATHVRVGDPLATHTMFPIYFGALIWGGLFLRDSRVRALIPWMKS